MKAFASLLRSYAGINLFQGYRILHFSSYLRLLISRGNMICQIMSTETVTASETTEDKSQVSFFRFAVEYCMGDLLLHLNLIL